MRCDEAVSVWWQIALDPESTAARRPVCSGRSDTAIANAEAWTAREPERAEAWFARGAAYGARAQWRVLRRERLAAARDGKRIKEALERALALDPLLHDAKFGLGMYRYYADVAPAALRLLRWLLLLPGGDRAGGLQADDRGARSRARDARRSRVSTPPDLSLVRTAFARRAAGASRSAARYPRNPLFQLAEAEIHDVYFHDRDASERTLRSLIALADLGRVNAATDRETARRAIAHRTQCAQQTLIDREAWRTDLYRSATT